MDYPSALKVGLRLKHFSSGSRQPQGHVNSFWAVVVDSSLDAAMFLNSLSWCWSMMWRWSLFWRRLQDLTWAWACLAHTLGQRSQYSCWEDILRICWCGLLMDMVMVRYRCSRVKKIEVERSVGSFLLWFTQIFWRKNVRAISFWATKDEKVRGLLKLTPSSLVSIFDTWNRRSNGWEKRHAFRT